MAAYEAIKRDKLSLITSKFAVFKSMDEPQENKVHLYKTFYKHIQSFF